MRDRHLPDGCGNGETRPITVPVIDDTADEPDETFTVTLTSATGASIDTAARTVTILDNDPGPLAMAVEAPAANGTYAQPVTLSGWAIDGAATNGAGVDARRFGCFPV